MGMDVYGTKPITPEGEYFRRSIWGWHPLWNLCDFVAPELTREVEFAHSNDGDGLGGEHSRALARALVAAVRSGQVEDYINAREAALDATPLETCGICEGTGVRRDEVGRNMGMDERGHCNGCSNEPTPAGTRRAHETQYGLERRDVIEFAQFLVGCGGFEIN